MSRHHLAVIGFAGITLAGATLGAPGAPSPRRSTAQASVPSPTPTLKSTRPCVSASVGHELTGTGWTPDGLVRVRGRYIVGKSSGKAFDRKVRADAEGRIHFTANVPDAEAITVRTEVTAEDVSRTAAGDPVEERTARTRYRATFYGVFYRPWNTDAPAKGRPGRAATIEAMGWIGPQVHLTGTLYAHYARLGDDPRWRTFRVGRLTGACRSFKGRFREFPWKQPKPGIYTVRFDTMPRASDSTWDSIGYRRVRVG